ncbi:hypothetical protein F4860DRAFT_529970 [Xylaria cubensis]|nr:hypothetical protein F4860DRAFT_529970 [Xylaria cubensis]
MCFYDFKGIGTPRDTRQPDAPREFYRSNYKFDPTKYGVPMRKHSKQGNHSLKPPRLPAGPSSDPQASSTSHGYSDGPKHYKASADPNQGFKPLQSWAGPSKFIRSIQTTAGPSSHPSDDYKIRLSGTGTGKGPQLVYAGRSSMSDLFKPQQTYAGIYGDPPASSTIEHQSQMIRTLNSAKLPQSPIQVPLGVPSVTLILTSLAPSGFDRRRNNRQASKAQKDVLETSMKYMLSVIENALDQNANMLPVVQTLRKHIKETMKHIEKK